MRPLLAAKLEKLEDVKFPVLVSPKLDGIRCLIHKAQAVSRKLIPLPNRFLQECLFGLPEGLDGEIMIAGKNFNEIQSAVMSEDGFPNFRYNVFDIIMDKSYGDRYLSLKAINNPCVEIVDTSYCDNLEQLKRMEITAIQNGYEGIMLRSANGIYKFGRSTLKEGILLKYKRFKDDEAIIIGFEEKYHNSNEVLKDNLGYTKRSTYKINKIPMNTLGALKVQWNNKKFNIGTGFTDILRKDIWEHRNDYLGALTTFTYQELLPTGIPRFPVFKTIRMD